MFVRVVGDKIFAYNFVTEPAAFALSEGQGEEVGYCAIASDVSRAVFLTETDVVCIDRTGLRLWAQPMPHPASDGPESMFMHLIEFSLDGTVLWNYGEAGDFDHGSHVTWQVLDASTGIVLAETKWQSTGFGGSQYVHPDGVHTLLTLSADEGFRTYQGRFNGVALEMTRFPLSDRGLLGLSRDGSGMMTVDKDMREVAFHTYPDGGITGRVRIEDFGESFEETNVGWASGYLDEQAAIVVLVGETDDEQDWHRAYLVDALTARVLGPFETQARDVDDVELLGDGSWVTIDEDGNPIRHTR